MRSQAERAVRQAHADARASGEGGVGKGKFSTRSTPGKLKGKRGKGMS